MLQRLDGHLHQPDEHDLLGQHLLHLHLSLRLRLFLYLYVPLTHVLCFFCYASAKILPSSSVTCSLAYSLWKSFLRRSR